MKKYILPFLVEFALGVLVALMILAALTVASWALLFSSAYPENVAVFVLVVFFLAMVWKNTQDRVNRAEIDAKLAKARAEYEEALDEN